MSITTICWLVYVVISLVCYIVSTALAIKRKKSDKNVTSEEYDTFVKTEVGKVLEYILNAEAKYNLLCGGDIKAGQFKLEDVIYDIKDDCLDASMSFDKEYWTKFVNNVVSCMNIKKETSVQTEDSVSVKGVTV